MECGINVKLTNGSVKMFLDGHLIRMGAKDGRILRMKFKTIWSAEVNAAEGQSIKFVHKKLGHASIETIKKMAENGAIVSLKFSDKSKFFCEACKYGKQVTINYRPVMPRKTELEDGGEMVHSDVCGRFNVEGLGGKNYSTAKGLCKSIVSYLSCKVKKKSLKR